jgi:hypothetical protein
MNIEAQGMPVTQLLGPKLGSVLETTCLCHLASVLDRLDIRAGDVVRVERSVEVEQDTRVSGGVELGEVATVEGLGTASSDLEVDALRVSLGTIGLAGRVEANDLVAENVVTGLEVLGDGELPGEAIPDEVVGGPVTGVAARLEALLSNLGPLEAALVDAGEVAADGGEVLSDGTVVGLGPCVPLQGDNISGGNGDGVLDGLGALVADDIGSVEGIRRNEAVVLVASSPADSVSGSTVRNTTGVLLAASDNSLDVAVSIDGSGEEGNEAERECVAVHDCGFGGRVMDKKTLLGKVGW